MIKIPHSPGKVDGFPLDSHRDSGAMNQEARLFCEYDQKSVKFKKVFY